MKLCIVFFALLLGYGIAEAQTGTPKSKPSLSAEIGNCFPDNTSGQISPATMRNCMQDFLVSWMQYSGVNLQTGTAYSVQNSDYGQMIISASSIPSTVTLPAPTLTAGFYPFSLWANVQGIGAVTYTPPPPVTIGGQASATLFTNQTAYIIADGTNWQIVFSTNAPSTTILGGTANSLAYYPPAAIPGPLAGTTLGPLPQCNNGVYATNLSGVPSCTTTLPPGLTLSAPTIGPDAGIWNTFGINGTAIGATTPATGNFTGLSFGTLDPASLGASPTTVSGLTTNNTPNTSNDFIPYFSASAGAIVKANVGSIAVAATAGVASLNGLTGVLNLKTTGGGTIGASGTTVTLAAPGGYLNKFRNGAFDVWQRGISGLSTAAYTADGWVATQSGAAATCSRQAGVAGLTLYALRCIGVASNTSTVFQQKIESMIAAPLAGNIVTVQFWYQQTTGVSVTPKISTCFASAQDNFTTCTADLAASNLTACASATWCLESYTLNVSVSASNGYRVLFDCNTALTAAQFCQITAADVRVTPGVTIGVNTSPPPPELRPIQTELAFCQRYFAKTFPYTVVPADNAGQPGAIAGYTGSFDGGHAFVLTWKLPVTMRVLPTITTFNPFSVCPACIGDFFGGAVASGVYNVIPGTENAVWAGTQTVSFTPSLQATASAEL